MLNHTARDDVVYCISASMLVNMVQQYVVIGFKDESCQIENETAMFLVRGITQFEPQHANREPKERGQDGSLVVVRNEAKLSYQRLGGKSYWEDEPLHVFARRRAGVVDSSIESDQVRILT